MDGVCAMLNHACTILEQDFREVLFGRVRAGFPSGFDLSQAYNMVSKLVFIVDVKVSGSLYSFHLVRTFIAHSLKFVSHVMPKVEEGKSYKIVGMQTCTPEYFDSPKFKAKVTLHANKSHLFVFSLIVLTLCIKY